MKTKAVCLFLAVVMLVSFASCTVKVKAEELSAGYNRQATESGEVTKEFRMAMADFSMTLFKGLVTKDDSRKNDLVSPLSAVICLAMLANGADGETLAQMEAAFGMDMDSLNRCLYAYTSSLYTAKDCKLSLADSIWLRDEAGRLHVNESFLQTNADWYNAQIYAAPFDDSTLRDINNWCKKYTDGMIREMIDKIDEYTVMYLINAMAFDAQWAEKYEKKDIRDGDFANYDGTSARVFYLNSKERTYLSDASIGVTGFARPYAGEAYSFVGLLPDKGQDIYDVISGLTGEAWMTLWEARSTGVTVSMPEFTCEADMRLNDVLKDMGMTDMFDNADFSHLGYSEHGDLVCSEVGQKTFVQVDRNGTKAAAITWAGVNDGGMGETIGIEEHLVILDRPFLYAIIDNATGLPLFIGTVTEL